MDKTIASASNFLKSKLKIKKQLGILFLNNDIWFDVG